MDEHLQENSTEVDSCIVIIMNCEFYIIMRTIIAINIKLYI